MVKIVNGNLLDAKEDLICHQVNCQGVMGSGVAKAIKDKWPNVYEAYRMYCDKYIQRSESPLGTVQYVDVFGDRTVVNMFAQDLYGYDGKRFTSYDAFYKCLEDIDAMPPWYSVAFPYKIASDRGGASWDVIYAMICDVMRDRDVTIYKLDVKEDT